MHALVDGGAGVWSQFCLQTQCYTSLRENMLSLAQWGRHALTEEVQRPGSAFVATDILGWFQALFFPDRLSILQGSFSFPGFAPSGFTQNTQNAHHPTRPPSSSSICLSSVPGLSEHMHGLWEEEERAGDPR